MTRSLVSVLSYVLIRVPQPWEYRKSKCGRLAGGSACARETNPKQMAVRTRSPKRIVPPVAPPLYQFGESRSARGGNGGSWFAKRICLLSRSADLRESAHACAPHRLLRLW